MESKRQHVGRLRQESGRHRQFASLRIEHGPFSRVCKCPECGISCRSFLVLLSKSYLTGLASCIERCNDRHRLGGPAAERGACSIAFTNGGRNLVRTEHLRACGRLSRGFCGPLQWRGCFPCGCCNSCAIDLALYFVQRGPVGPGRCLGCYGRRVRRNQFAAFARSSSRFAAFARSSSRFRASSDISGCVGCSLLAGAGALLTTTVRR